MTFHEYRFLNSKYHELSDEGLSYAIGKAGERINNISGIGDIIVRSDNNVDIAVYDDGTKYILVSDAHGVQALRAVNFIKHSLKA